MSKIVLLKEFVKSPGSVGIIFPSSWHLAEEMLKNIGINNAKTVVEIGPGTGVFTKHIVLKISHETKFIVVELNKTFHSNLRKKFPHLKIMNDSAERLSSILASEKTGKADVIISGLPWASFTEDLQTRIINQIYECLAPGGYFATYAYIQGTILPAGIKVKKILRKKFKNVDRSPVVWKNIPPAFVYRCRKEFA
jgi:phospholipid N-methyltransferase